MTHRIKACQQRYQGLRKLLNGSHHLDTHHRIRLWRACVCTSVLYSQHIVGVTSNSLQKLTTLLTRHLRAILRVPAHLTHVTDHAVWSQANLPLPGWQLQHALQVHHKRLLHKQSATPDITTTPQALEFLDQQAGRLEAVLLKAAKTLVSESSAMPLVNCPKCDQAFATVNAMRIHCSLQHKHLPQIQTKIPTTFCPATHSQAGMPACRLCNRQFFRWTHLKQHIESSACSALGGASNSRSPVPDAIPAQIRATAQLPIFEGQNSQHTPLVQRQAFLAGYSNLEKWLAMTAVRQELKNHCAICHMWIAASFRHVKQHYNRIHAADHPDLLQRTLKVCGSFKSHLRRNSACIWCGNTVGAPHRHTQQCTPLIQLVLAQLYCQDVHGQGRPSSERGGGDLRQLLGVLPTGGVLHVRTHRATLPEEASTRTADSLEHANSQPAPPPGISNAASTSRCPPAASSPHARPAPSSQPSCPETGGDHQSATPREDLCALHAERDQRHLRHPHENRQGLAKQEEPGRGTAPVPPPHHLARQHAPRSHESCPAGRGHRGLQGEAHPVGMAHERGSVELSLLEPRREKTPGRSESHGPPARRSNPTLDLPAQEPERRGHPEVCRDTAAGHVGTARSPVRHIPSGSVPARTDRAGNIRDPGEADGLRPAEPHRGLNEKRHFAQHAVGQKAGGHGVQEARTATEAHMINHSLPQHNTTLTSLTTHPGTSNIGDDGAELPDLLPHIRLQGGSNNCYLNSFLYGLLVAMRSCHMHALAHQVFGKTSGTPHKASRLIGFKLLGWPAPQTQHDVAELIDFLHPRLIPNAMSGHWESRDLSAEGLTRQAQASVHKCIRLPLDPAAPNPEIQESIRMWHQQQQLQGFTMPPAWLFLQLPRFHYEAAGRAVKLQHAYIIPHTLDIPVFCDLESLEVNWVPYTVKAYIQHHGDEPTSGHYTTVVQDRVHHWLLDDEKTPSLLEMHQLEHVSTNMYVIVLVSTHMLSAAVDALHIDTAPHIHDDRSEPPPAQNSAGGGHQLVCKPSQFTSDADSRAGRGHGSSPTDPKPDRSPGTATRDVARAHTQAYKQQVHEAVDDSAEAGLTRDHG